MIMKTPIITVALTLVTLTAAAQRTYHLTLDESIAIAREQSYTMRSLILDSLSAENDLRAELARYRTNVSLRLNVPNYTENVQEWSDSTGITYFPVERLRNSATLDISQRLPSDGTLSLSSGLSATDDYYRENRTAQFNTQLRLVQPLEPLFGYNQYRSDIRLARLSHDRALKQIQRDELAMISQVSNGYYSLLSQQESVNIARMNLDNQTEAFKMSKDKFAAGLVREVDNLQMEVDLAAAQDEYDGALLAYVSSANLFKVLIGLELADSLVLRSELRYEAVTVDPELAVELALKNRYEIQNWQIQIEQQDILLRQRKAAGLPSANLEAYYDLTGVGTDMGRLQNYWWTIDHSLADMRQRPSNFGVGLSMTVPIFNWGRHRSLIRSAEAGLQQARMGKTEEERNIETDVRNVAASVQSSLSRLQLQERNIPVAEKNFEITLARYTNGDIDSQTLSEARVRLNNAYISRLRAFIDYQMALVELMQKTFYDFQRDIPVE
jgi:outer membrane protein TolC